MIMNTYQFDPTNKFTEVTDAMLYEACGILPTWVMAKEYAHKPLLEALKEQYQFPMFESEKATITEDGVFQYPGDPDQHPLIKIQRGKETFYQYEHAMIAIVQEDGSSYVSRMD